MTTETYTDLTALIQPFCVQALLLIQHTTTIRVKPLSRDLVGPFRRYILSTLLTGRQDLLTSLVERFIFPINLQNMDIFTAVFLIMLFYGHFLIFKVNLEKLKELFLYFRILASSSFFITTQNTCVTSCQILKRLQQRF